MVIPAELNIFFVQMNRRRWYELCTLHEEVDTAKAGYQRVSTMQQQLPSHLGRRLEVRSSS